MSLKILFVGSNSRVFKAIVNSGALVNYDVLSVSGKHLEISMSRISQENYSAVVILSYSKVRKDNELLFSQLSNIKSQLFIYISSISALCAEFGYKYSYPSSKLQCEKLAKYYFSKLKILRVGLVPEVHKPPYCHSYVTRASQLANCIIDLARGFDVTENLYLESHYTNQAGLFEKISYSLYRRLFQYMGGNVVLLRPVDLVLRAIGYNWYGYHMAINMKKFAHD